MTVEVRQTFRAHPGRECEVRDLLAVATELLQRIGVLDRTVTEEPAGAFTETWRFASRDEWEQADDLFPKDRKLAAIHALLDDLIEPDSSDFVVIEDGDLPNLDERRRCGGAEPDDLAEDDRRHLR